MGEDEFDAAARKWAELNSALDDTIRRQTEADLHVRNIRTRLRATEETLLKRVGKNVPERVVAIKECGVVVVSYGEKEGRVRLIPWDTLPGLRS